MGKKETNLTKVISTSEKYHILDGAYKIRLEDQLKRPNGRQRKLNQFSETIQKPAVCYPTDINNYSKN